MPKPDAKIRFSPRVSDYVKFRPTYPGDVIEILRERIGLKSDWEIADVGCGTGISSKLFIENGNEVFGVEPNADMRGAAIEFIGSQDRFHPIDGSAEHTTLADESVDLVIAAQAWHWFDHASAEIEFRRILRSPGFVLCMWNSRLANTSAFAIEYDDLLHRYGTDYRNVAHRSSLRVEDFANTFGVPFDRVTVPNFQSFDADELAGRVRSSSYTPLPGQAGHGELFVGLKELFVKHQQGGRVRFEYETELFFGKVR